MHKRFLILGSILAGVAVILGAFGAHGLRQYVPQETVSTFETGVRYQFYHCFALMLCGFSARWFSDRWTKYAACCFIIGLLLFSGSLYTLTIMKATSTVGLTGIGIITPVGGLFFIAGWVALTRAFMLMKTN